MTNTLDIRFISGEEIDKVKWNSCVHYAGNGNIFAYKWYLDFVAKDWDALVEGDYESVFPLIWRKNIWGKKELHQPLLMRELGVFSINVLSQTRIRAFLEAIPDDYRAIDIQLNERNRPPERLDFQVENLMNHQLMLQKPYEILQEQFSEKVREEITRAEEEELVSTTNLKPEAVADFFRRHKPGPNQETTFHALQRIMYNVLHRGWGFAAGAQDRNGQLLAVNFYIYSHGRVLSLIPVQSREGKEKGALSFLFDMLIRSHANRPLVLDFNTAAPDELALNLGALSNAYYRLHRNHKLLGLI